MAAMSWHPMTDLIDAEKQLVNPELVALAGVWNEQRAHLQGSSALREFNERMAREWAIETGILERLYTLDRGITQLLIERGISGWLDRSVLKALEIWRRGE